MADLASANVTITIQAGDPWNPRIEGNYRKCKVKIAYGNGVLTYPAGGVPMPDYTSFGLVRNLSHVEIIDANDASGIVWKWDYENKKVRGFYRAAFTPSGSVSAITPAGTISAITPAGSIAPITPAGQSAAHTHNLYVPTPVSADAAGNRVQAALDGTNLYVSQPAGGNAPITIAGLAAGATAHGGVVGLAAGSPAFTGTEVTPSFSGTQVTPTLTGTQVTPTFTGTADSAVVLTELASGSYAVPAQVLYGIAVGW